MQRPGETGDRASRRLVLVGASFRTAEPALRERLFLDEVAAARLTDAVIRHGCAEALVLPTCDRLEIYAVTEAAQPVAALVADMATLFEVAPDALASQIYRLEEAEAEQQLFAVAASLDSAVPGETQVLAQLKDAHRRAQVAGAIGPLLEPLLQAAYGCAKRVVSETALARHPVSMVAAARNVAQRLHGDLAAASALLIGLGDMGLLIADALRSAGLARLAATHPNESRASGLARELGIAYRPWAELADALAGADIVIAAMGIGRIVVTRPMVETALAARRRRPVLLLDTAIPGDIEPGAGEPADAFLYGLEDLDRLAQDGLSNRQEAAEAARALVAEAASLYRRDRAARGTAPALARLRDRFEAARSAVLASHGDDAAEATRRLLNRLLHDPAQALRALAGTPEAAEAERWLTTLFGETPQREDEERKDGA
jgi:glutamyl-tRNA reductase